MAQIKVPPAFPQKDALALIAGFNKFAVSIEEDAAVCGPTLVIPGQPEIFGFVPVAFAISRQTKAMEKNWAKTFLGDGNAANSAQIEQFASMADSLLNGADSKTVVGQIQMHLKSRTYLVNDALSIADLLLYVVLHPIVVAFNPQEQKRDFADVVRWMIQTQSVVQSPFAEIVAPAEFAWKSHAGAGGAKPKAPQQQRMQGQKKEKKPAAPKPAPVKDDRDPLSLIDIRVSQIVEVWPHPNADALYCEKIDIGGGVIKRVVTGVRNFVPLEEMQNRKVVVFTNIKPSKIRGEPSEAMVFAASNEEHTKVELLTPPEGTPIGTRVVCGDFVQGENPPVDKNGKNWKVIAEGGVLTVNGDHLACYKGVPLSVPEGNITVATLANCEFH